MSAPVEMANPVSACADWRKCQEKWIISHCEVSVIGSACSTTLYEQYG